MANDYYLKNLRLQWFKAEGKEVWKSHIGLVSLVNSLWDWDLCWESFSGWCGLEGHLFGDEGGGVEQRERLQVSVTEASASLLRSSEVRSALPQSWVDGRGLGLCTPPLPATGCWRGEPLAPELQKFEMWRAAQPGTVWSWHCSGKGVKRGMWAVHPSSCETQNGEYVSRKRKDPSYIIFLFYCFI